jgi:hypothetical protein
MLRRSLRFGRDDRLGNCAETERWASRSGGTPLCFSYVWETRRLRENGLYVGETKELGENETKEDSPQRRRGYRCKQPFQWDGMLCKERGGKGGMSLTVTAQIERCPNKVSWVVAGHL